MYFVTNSIKQLLITKLRHCTREYSKDENFAREVRQELTG